jgi:opacity protein-like surface antigen
MKKTIGLTAVLIFLLPCLGFSHAISVRLGYFVPRAGTDSELWTIEFENMDFTKTNFQNAILGFSYEHFLTRELSLVFGFDGYSQSRYGFYRDFVGYSFEEGDFAFPLEYEGDFDIGHGFSTSITPIQASIKVAPLGRRSGLIPYLGGGVTLFIWGVKLQGSMIDFADDSWVYEDPDYGDVQIYPIYETNAREETQFAVGYHAFAGLMIPFARRVAFEAEFKYNFGKGKLNDAFEGFNNFDLSGFQISLGINYWF